MASLPDYTTESLMVFFGCVGKVAKVTRRAVDVVSDNEMLLQGDGTCVAIVLSGITDMQNAWPTQATVFMLILEFLITFVSNLKTAFTLELYWSK